MKFACSFGSTITEFEDTATAQARMESNDADFDGCWLYNSSPSPFWLVVSCHNSIRKARMPQIKVEINEMCEFAELLMEAYLKATTCNHERTSNGPTKPTNTHESRSSLFQRPMIHNASMLYWWLTSIRAIIVKLISHFLY